MEYPKIVTNYYQNIPESNWTSSYSFFWQTLGLEKQKILHIWEPETISFLVIDLGVTIPEDYEFCVSSSTVQLLKK